MVIYKEPLFENDSYMFVLEQHDKLKDVPMLDNEYYVLKQEMFKRKVIKKSYLEAYSYRPSLTNIHEVDDLSGSIYTYTCEGKNDLSYERIIEAVRNNYASSRRCNINFADTLYNYLKNRVNTSCLNSIHYCQDNVTLYFRASDILWELLIDLHLIKEFFIDPVGEFKTITVIASTTQNYNVSLKTLLQ